MSITFTPGWVDITSYVVGDIVTATGRQHELSRIETGTMKLTVTSDDDRFNPANTSSPYYPDVKVMVPIRVTAVDPQTSTTHNIWYGYVKAWPQKWTHAGKISRVHLSCIDVLSIFAHYRITDWDTVIAKDSPLAWWKFNETANTQPLADSSGNSNNGDIKNVVPANFKSDGPIGEDGNIQFDRTNSDVVEDFTNEAAFRLDGDLTLELVLKLSAATYTEEILSEWISGNALYRIYATNGTSTRHIAYIGSSIPIVTLILNHPIDEWVWLTVTRTAVGLLSIYVNGVHTDSVLIPPVTSLGTEKLHIGNGPNGNFTGAISELAIYDKVLTPGRIRTHYDSRWRGSGYSVLATMQGLEDYLDWPIVDETQFKWQGTAAAWNNQQDHIPSIAFDESATSLFRRFSEAHEATIHQLPDGKLALTERTFRASDKATPSVTLAESGADGSYLDIVIPSDNTQLRNKWSVTPVGGSSEDAVDTASVEANWPREQSIANALIADPSAVASQSLALQRAQAGLAKSSTVYPRISTLKLTGSGNPFLWAYVMGLTVHDRIKVERTPPGGTKQTEEAYIERVAHRISPRLKWETTWSLSPADRENLWLLDSAVMSKLGETTVLGW